MHFMLTHPQELELAGRELEQRIKAQEAAEARVTKVRSGAESTCMFDAVRSLCSVWFSCWLGAAGVRTAGGSSQHGGLGLASVADTLQAWGIAPHSYMPGVMLPVFCCWCCRMPCAMEEDD